MDPQFEELARHVADEVEKRVSKRVRGAEKRLARGTRVHLEDLKSVVTLAAEGYGATLDRIERQLTELNSKWDTEIVDHDRVLADHNRRIAKLETKSG
jgi:hypothetical protein